MTVSLFHDSALDLSTATEETRNTEPRTCPSVIRIGYELVRGNEDRFLNQILPCVRKQSTALDLSAVERMDAAGIAALITAYCAAMEAKTQFFIVSPSGRVLDLLQLVGLESILTANGIANGLGSGGREAAPQPRHRLAQSAA